ncbi:MAG: hypothetical protein QNJ44_22685 [Rhodobacter sp.]|nr:hypothetical protein [Rhodobacter sp.]
MRGPNTSSAVMQQRREPPDSFDDFPTHPWATRAMLEKLTERGHALHLQTVWEPCCNRGFMAMPLAEAFDKVIATDIFDYGWQGQQDTFDFLGPWPGWIDDAVDACQIDWVIANPPFNLADQFIRMALSVAQIGVMVFVRGAFDEGEGRYNALFRDLPEAYDFPFVQRVPIHRGKLRHPRRKYWVPSDDPDAEPDDGTWKTPSTATAYKWLGWLTIEGCATDKDRIAPCRDRLMREDDYPIRHDDEFGPGGPDATLPLLREAGL